MSENSQEEYELRLRRRLEILKQQLEAGTLKINSGLRVAESLKSVRYGADGRVDLSSVDSLVRSLALTVETIYEREEIKKSIPLRELQSGHFENIQAIFGTL